MRENPDIDQLKRQAMELLEAYRGSAAKAVAHDVQFVLARSYGFEFLRSPGCLYFGIRLEHGLGVPPAHQPAKRRRPMFTTEYRAELRSELLELASGDKRISGAAVTGSAAADSEDRWSDIDLAFGVADPSQVPDVLSDFTAFMYERHRALFHHDVRAGNWIYRVFFVPGTLQVDLAFIARSEFRPLGPTFRLIFGEANAANPFPRPLSSEVIGLAWLHALHARTSILRGRFWQAEYMISATRDHVMSLACIRHGLPSAHGRGMDQLPDSVTSPLLRSLVRELHPEELWRALGAAVQSLVTEVESLNLPLAAGVVAGLKELFARPPSA